MEVPCVEVPLDFLTTGVLGSLRRSWVKSGSCSTCLLSCTALLRWEKDGKVGRESQRSEGRERGKAEGIKEWK